MRACQTALWLAVALLGTGCASPHGAPGAKPPAAANGAPLSDRYKVVADTTPFYHLGPQQPNGPDLSLKKGDEITMIRRAFGYSQVKTPDGDLGFVGTEDVTQVTAEDVASDYSSTLELMKGTQKRSSGMVGEYKIPPGAGDQERLPEADASPAPKASPSPNFHY